MHDQTWRRRDRAWGRAAIVQIRVRLPRKVAGRDVGDRRQTLREVGDARRAPHISLPPYEPLPFLSACTIVERQSVDDTRNGEVPPTIAHVEVTKWVEDRRVSARRLRIGETM